MKIGSVSENKEFEKRVAITPDIIKKYISLGLEVNIGKSYAEHLGINDSDYSAEGANILDSNDEVISNSDALLQMSILDKENLNKLKKNQSLIGVLDYYLNEKILKELSLKKLIFRWFYQLLEPIIDTLSQPNLAVIRQSDSFSFSKRYNDDDCSWYYYNVKVLIGAGVAGLQAIAKQRE